MINNLGATTPALAGWSCCGVGVLSCHSLKQCVGVLPQVDSLLKHHKYGTRFW